MPRESRDLPRLPGLSLKVRQTVAATVLAATALILLGWAIDNPLLYGPGTATTKPNGAVALGLCAAAMLLHGSGDVGKFRKWAGRGGAVLAVLLGLATLTEYLLNTDLHLNDVLFTGLITADAEEARIRPSASVAFIATAVGLLITSSGSAHRTGEGFVIGSGFIALASIIGFVSGPAEIYVRNKALAPIGLYVAVLVLALDAAILSGCRSTRGLPAIVVSPHAGGQAARRLLPWALLLPFALTAAIQLVQRLRLINAPLGIGFMVATITACLTGAVLAMAVPLNRTDAARGRALLRAETLNAELQREVVARQNAQAALAEANQSLRLNNAALSRSNEDLRHFASVASHDLQEPLRKIVSFSGLLVERFPDAVDAEAHGYLDRVVNSATRMQQLIDDLLRFSRVGEPANLAPVDCNQSLARVLDNLHLPVQESGAVVTAGPLPVLTVNGVQLEQLLQNLVGNALKYRSEEPPRIHLEATHTPDGWRFTVSDNGIGIDMEYADRIFLIFQRLHPRGAYGGTGIGLAVCRRIVESYGGRIGVTSSPGTGSIFWFTLPVPGHPTAAAPPLEGVLEEAVKKVA